MSASVRKEAEWSQVFRGLAIAQQKIVFHKLLYRHPGRYIGSLQSLLQEVEATQEVLEEQIVLTLHHTFIMFAKPYQLGLDEA